MNWKLVSQHIHCTHDLWLLDKAFVYEIPGSLLCLLKHIITNRDNSIVSSSIIELHNCKLIPDLHIKDKYVIVHQNYKQSDE